MTIGGTLDYTIDVTDDGIRAFRVDGRTGTIAVFLEGAPARDLDSGDCLTVTGTVAAETDRGDTDGPVFVDATLAG